MDPHGKVVMILAGRPKTADEAAWKKAGGIQAAIAGLGARGAAAIFVVASASGDAAYAPLADRYGRRSVANAGAMPAWLPSAPYKRE